MDQTIAGRICGPLSNHSKAATLKSAEPTPAVSKAFLGTRTHENGKHFVGRITINSIGLFDDKLAAAAAYERFAVEAFGEFARAA